MQDSLDPDAALTTPLHTGTGAMVLSLAAGHGDMLACASSPLGICGARGRSNGHSSRSTGEAPCSQTTALLGLQAPQPIRLTAARESPFCVCVWGGFKTAFVFMSRQRRFPYHWNASFHAAPRAAGQEPTWRETGMQPLAAGAGHARGWVSLGMKRLKTFVQPLPPPTAV